MDAVAVTAAKDLLRLSAAADTVLRIHEVKVTQETDAGDAESEQLAIQLQRSSTTGTGTAATPEALDPGLAAASATAVVDLTADTTISGAPLHREAQNVMAGWHWLFTPEMRPVIGGQGHFVVRLDQAPADSITMSLTCVFEELG